MKIPLKDVLDILTDIKHQNDQVKQSNINMVHKMDQFVENLSGLFNDFFTNQHLITEKIDQFMQTTQERFDAILSRLDSATNTIADNYKNLLDQIKKGTVSEASLTQAETDISKLEQIGKPSDPITSGGTGATGTGGTDTGAGAGTTGNAGAGATTGSGATTGTVGDVTNADGSVTHADGTVTAAPGAGVAGAAGVSGLPGANG